MPAPNNNKGYTSSSFASVVILSSCAPSAKKNVTNGLRRFFSAKTKTPVAKKTALTAAKAACKKDKQYAGLQLQTDRINAMNNRKEAAWRAALEAELDRQAECDRLDRHHQQRVVLELVMKGDLQKEDFNFEDFNFDFYAPL